MSADAAGSTEIPGDPGAVEAAADHFTSAAKGFTTAGEDVGRRGRAATAQWTGSASEAAGAAIAALSTRVGEGSGVCTRVAAVLRVYAAALRAAQSDHAAAHDHAVAGGQLAMEASRAHQAADRLAADDPGRERAVAATAAALASAQQQVTTGTHAMADAVAAAHRANEAAAAAIEPLLDAVAAMAPALPPGISSWHDAAPSPAEVASGQGATNDTSPWALGWQWLTGTGPRHQEFHAGDPMTEQLRQHEVIRQDQEIVRKELARGDWTPGKPLKHVESYSLGGLGAVPQYLGDYSTVIDGGLTGDLAATFLGSYAVTATVVEVHGPREAVVEYHVTNTSSFASSVHVPGHGDIPGYSHLEDWENSLFPTGPLSKTTQSFTWEETVTW